MKINSKKLILALLMVGMTAQPLNAGIWDSVGGFFINNWGKIFAVSTLCLGFLWAKLIEQEKELILSGDVEGQASYLSKEIFEKHRLGYLFLDGNRAFSDSEYRVFNKIYEYDPFNKQYSKKISQQGSYTLQDYLGLMSLVVTFGEKDPKMLKNYKKSIKEALEKQDHTTQKNFLKECIKINNNSLVKFVLPFVLSEKKYISEIDDLVNYAKKIKAINSLSALAEYRKNALSLRGDITSLVYAKHKPKAFPYEIINQICSY